MVIVDHLTSALVERLLADTSRWRRRRGCRCVIVENAGGCGPRLEPGENVEMLRLDANRGFADAANRGAAMGHGEWLIFINPDVVAGENCLDALVSEAVEPGVLGGTTPGGPRAHGRALSQERPGVVEVEWVSGSLLAVERSVFEAAGGFDPSYFMYLEDVDLCDRLREQGYPVRVVSAAGYEHPGGASYAASGRDKARDFRTSRQLYLARRHGPVAGWMYGLWTALRRRVGQG